jgi:hypothetical protein
MANTIPPALPEPIRAAIAEFDDYRASKRDFGTCDTEPDGVFHYVIRQAYERKPFPINLNADRWEIFDGPGADAVADGLNDRARKVYDAILKHATSDDKPALAGYAWRVRF